MSEISGETPYGASTMAGGDDSRPPNEDELAMVRYSGKFVANGSKVLVRGRQYS